MKLEMPQQNEHEPLVAETKRFKQSTSPADYLLNPKNVYVSTHPLTRTLLSQLRDPSTTSDHFRQLLDRIGQLLCYEATKDHLTWTVQEKRSSAAPITMSITRNGSSNHISSSSLFEYEVLKEKVAIVPILRSGLGLVGAFMSLIPKAILLHLGIFREKKTLQPVEYYNKLPEKCEVDVAFLLDPMLATGGTAMAAIDILNDWGVRKIVIVSVVASREGIARILDKYCSDNSNSPKDDLTVEIVTGAIDPELDEQGWILPGLGDIGHRMFGTGY